MVIHDSPGATAPTREEFENAKESEGAAYLYGLDADEFESFEDFQTAFAAREANRAARHAAEQNNRDKAVFRALAVLLMVYGAMKAADSFGGY